MRIRTVFTVILCLALVFTANALCWAADSFYPFVYISKGDVLLSEKPGQKPLKLGNGYDPSLSPGGKHAVWIEKVTDQNDRIVISKVGSRKTKRLVKQGGFLLSPRWSPKGDVVLYLRRTKGRSELWTVKPRNEPVLLASADNATGDDFFEPFWTPDGERVCYHDMSYLYQMTLDGKVASKTELTAFGDPKMFTSSDRFVLRPNAQGTLVFTRSVPGSTLFQKKVPDMSSALFLYDAASKAVTRITGENMTAFSPVWSQDGEEILFSGYTDAQAGAAYPFKVFSVRPGALPVELGTGQDPMPAPSR